MPAESLGPARRRLAWGLSLVSGATALACQIVWTQQASLWLGHESAAVLAVLAAFFGGLALGALWLAPRLERVACAACAYAGCEALIGAWTLLLALALEPAAAALMNLAGPTASSPWQWGFSFGGLFLLLLPATLAMGATLPALTRALDSGSGASASPAGVASLYAANTLGAVLGVLASAFWLLPQLGLTRTALLCAVSSAGCALLARFGLTGTPATAEQPPPAHRGRAGLPLRLAATGLLGLGYEVLGVRVLSQVAENTVYTFALLLAVYLAGSALGAAAYARWQRSAAPAKQAPAGRLLLALAWACLAGGAALWFADALKPLLAQGLARWTSEGYHAALAAEALLALFVFGAPTLLMGALFAALVDEAQHRGQSLGLAFGLNTLGAALAPPLVGVLALPALGSKTTLLLLAGGYALLAGKAWRRAPALTLLPLALTLAGVAALAPPLRFVTLPEGARLLAYHEGAMAAVSVVEHADGEAVLRINNRQQEGSSATALADSRQALLPVLLHPAPRSALFLGLGTGVTARAAASEADLQVDAVELLPEVLAAARLFEPLQPEGAARLRLLRADARRFVRSATPRYDLIVADNFHPARSGSGALYTVEHFRAVRARLAPGGLFCQWLPLHQLDLATLRSIVASYLQAFPQGGALLATLSLETPVLGLIGGHEALQLDPDRLAARLTASKQAEELGLGRTPALLGQLLAGPQALARWSAGAPLNTDDRPIVSYQAPRQTYAAATRPRDRLLELIDAWSGSGIELLQAPPAQAERQLAYWRARDHFLHAGREVQAVADVRRMLDQVQPALLEALRISADFDPAYQPLLQMAMALARDDPAAARQLLETLDRLQPARDEARLALQASAVR